MIDGTVPFGAPPIGFMQTGNQQVNLEPQNDTPFENTEDQLHNNSNSSENLLVEPQLPIEEPKVPTLESSKYKIIDLFWMLNPKFYKQPQGQLLSGEAHFAVISFNISFGNLRISYFDLVKGAIQGHVAFLKSFKRTVAGTIYPGSAFNAFSTPKITMMCLEQLFEFDSSAQWQQERPSCRIDKIEGKIALTIVDPKLGKYFYVFEGWQYQAFMKSLEFVFTKGFELSAHQRLKDV